MRRPLAERLVKAARDALTTVHAPVARRVLAADLALLTELSVQIYAAEAELAGLLPLSPFATLTTTPGWGVVRAGNYRAALGDPYRWPGPSQIYRASGLSPAQYESAGKRRDGSISREGSVALSRALIDLAIHPGPGRAAMGAETLVHAERVHTLQPVGSPPCAGWLLS